MNPKMSRTDRRAWKQARTLAELGELTARWLEGDIASQPGYMPNWSTYWSAPTSSLIQEGRESSGERLR